MTEGHLVKDCIHKVQSFLGVVESSVLRKEKGSWQKVSGGRAHGLLYLHQQFSFLSTTAT